MATGSSADPKSLSATHFWLNPPKRPKAIESLVLGVERYDPAQVQVLEDYLAQQFNEVFYDPLANLATLKLYQFNPDLVPLAAENPSNPIEAIHDSITIKILMLSITHRPFDSDFSLGLSMCGDRMSNLVTPQATLNLVSLLSQLSSTLQSRRFPAFWKLIASQDFEQLRPIIESIVDFDNLIRRSISKSVASCFKSISTDRLQNYLGYTNVEQVNCWIKEIGWSLVDGKARIPDNADNCPVTSIIRENTTLSDLKQMIARSVIV
ncbi:armadillo-type protein [Phakopsora pachyrhizi]|nr:armadillo-type protein [Phakopsora pachyrhizi]